MSESPPNDRDGLKPFMEHNTGHFKSAIASMANTVQPLRSLPAWSDWITFRVQSTGKGGTGCDFAEIRMHRELIDANNIVLDVEAISRIAHVEPSLIVRRGGVYELSVATPLETARILDAIFRHHLTIHVDEGEDYAIVAEW